MLLFEDHEHAAAPRANSDALQTAQTTWSALPSPTTLPTPTDIGIPAHPLRVTSVSFPTAMTSTSPLAAKLEDSARIPNGHSEEAESGRATKRLRLSEDATAAIQTQRARSDTSLEVDHMVLDYTAHQTIMACLASKLADGPISAAISLSGSLVMSNAFLSIFKARHSAYQPDPELRLRILLLKLTTLFTQRLTSNPTTPSGSALHALRSNNQERARIWIENADRMPSAPFDTSLLDNDLPISDHELERNRAHVLHVLDVPAEDENYEDAFYGTSSCLALLDIMPLFMQVSAARNAMSNSNLNERWMQMACEFMMQACLEQYLVFGAHGSDAIDEAFSWGYKDHGHDSSKVDGDDTLLSDRSSEVNDMFEDEFEATEVESWAETKTSYLDLLLPTDLVDDESNSTPCGPGRWSIRDENIAVHFETLAAKYPVHSFEQSVLDFLEALSSSLPQPMLTQIENGKLDGMSEHETHEFLVGCGIPTSKT